MRTRKSSFVRPYICRLISFSFLIAYLAKAPSQAACTDAHVGIAP